MITLKQVAKETPRQRTVLVADILTQEMLRLQMGMLGIQENNINFNNKICFMSLAKHLYLNLLATIVYFSISLCFFWRQSGGDIAMHFLFIICVIVHLVTISVIYLRFIGKRQLYCALLGIVIGCITYLLIYKSIEWYREKTIKQGVQEVGSVQEFTMPIGNGS